MTTKHVHAAPTQVQHPHRAMLRTAVQTVLGMAVAAGVVVPLAAQAVGDSFAQWLGADAAAKLTTVSLVSVAVSSCTARIMAIPQVNRWLAHVGLDAGQTVAPSDPPAQAAEPTPTSATPTADDITTEGA